MARSNAVRIGYARVSGRSQDHQLQLDALVAADCREVVVETASTRGARPKLRALLGRLQVGDTLVIYKPDRVARSMKELLVLLEDELHASEVNLEILSGICTGLHQPTGSTIADKMLFLVAAMAAEMERDLIHERTMDGLAAAEAQGRKGGRPAMVDDDTLAVALVRRERGEPVAAIAKHLQLGRSTLYRALATYDAHVGPAAAATPGPVRAEPPRRGRACPTCGHEPAAAEEARQQRHDLAVTWLYPDPAGAGGVAQRWHCAACQPHDQVATVVCDVCGDGPLLVGTLAEATTEESLAPAVRRWLAEQGWQTSPRLVCPEHQGTPMTMGQSSPSGSSGASGSRSGRNPLQAGGR
ncbi:MAG: recombinase family protein [Sciscionella sp.]